VAAAAGAGDRSASGHRIGKIESGVVVGSLGPYVLASARLRELVLIHSTMPGVKLRVVEREVLVQLGRGEEPEFASDTELRPSRADANR
jgi:hypothetical protein